MCAEEGQEERARVRGEGGSGGRTTGGRQAAARWDGGAGRLGARRPYSPEAGDGDGDVKDDGEDGKASRGRVAAGARVVIEGLRGQRAVDAAAVGTGRKRRVEGRGRGGLQGRAVCVKGDGEHAVLGTQTSGGLQG